MPRVTSLRVQHVRAHSDYALEVAPTVTVITGQNGSGKTSLVEALHVALQGSSFKGSDADILARGQGWYRVDVAFDDGSVRTVKFDSTRTTGRKQFTVNEKTHYRLSPQHKYPVVLFEPDDLRLLNGSPTRRRQFIDRFISQLDPKYAVALRRYERALRQRNVLLKQQAGHDALFAWDVSLSEYGGYIVDRRHEFIDSLHRQIGEVYRTIAHTDDAITLAYSQQRTTNTQQKLLADLHGSAGRDKLLGFTSVGPHRHDVLFSFNNSPAMAVASRGEVRSVVLALKFLEVTIIAAMTDKPPIILLDDVFSELDLARQTSLATGIFKNQTIITSATPVEVAEARITKLPE